MENTNKHYIIVDERSRIVGGFSDAFRLPSDGDICINEEGGRHFRLFRDGEDNPVLFEIEHRIPLYKYENGKVLTRTAKEIEAEIAALPVPEETPSRLDMLEAQATYTAMMTDTLLEV